MLGFRCRAPMSDSAPIASSCRFHPVGATPQLPALNHAQLHSSACPPFKAPFKFLVTKAQKQIKMTCLDKNCNIFSVSILISHLMDDIRFTLHIMSPWSGYHYRGPLEQSRLFLPFNYLLLSLSLYFSLKKIKHN